MQWLLSLKNFSQKLIRWRLKLEEYDFQIVYKKGKLNTNADALSQIPAITKNTPSKLLHAPIRNTPLAEYQFYLEHKLKPTNITDYKILEVEGDVLDAPPEDSLVHCISQDLKMSCGCAN